LIFSKKFNAFELHVVGKYIVYLQQVQGSTFRVKDIEGIKDPKSSFKMLIFPNNCQFGSKFWIRPDEADVFLVNTHPNAFQGREWNLEPLNH
jgi:hypothetical protein